MTLSPAPAATLLRDRLDHWASTRPGDTAITFGAQTFTWGQWRQRILRLAGALRDAGVRPGDRLTVLDLNHLATVELTLAASALGAATVPANFRLSPDQIRYILEDSRPVILFQGAQLADVAAAAGADSLVPRRMVIGGDSDEYEPFLAAGRPDEGSSAEPDDVLPRDVHLRHHRPAKGAQLTHRGVIAHSAACCAAMSIGPDTSASSRCPCFTWAAGATPRSACTAARARSCCENPRLVRFSARSPAGRPTPSSSRPSSTGCSPPGSRRSPGSAP